jgi:hypothetical protein
MTAKSRSEYIDHRAMQRDLRALKFTTASLLAAIRGQTDTIDKLVAAINAQNDYLSHLRQCINLVSRGMVNDPISGLWVDKSGAYHGFSALESHISEQQRQP